MGNELQDKPGPAKRVKPEVVVADAMPKSPLSLKRVKSQSSPASTPKSKLRPPNNNTNVVSNPTANYTITKQTQTTLSVPTLGELKEVQRWFEG